MSGSRLGSVGQLPANHIDKTISNVVVEDIDSKIIMANLVPNATKSSAESHLLSLSAGNIENNIGNTAETFGGKRREHLKSNASIINVDDDSYQLISSRYGFNKNIEEIKENIYRSENNICKLFVKEGTPPKVRKKEHMIGTNCDVLSLSSLSSNTNEKNSEVKEHQNDAEREETKTCIDTFQDYPIIPIISSFTQTNADCHKTEFKIDDHQNDILQGLNQLRNDGSFLDVTLWAENQPFQVGFFIPNI